MARRFEATVYSEKGREFKLYINDANYSGVINPIRLVTLNLNWDSNRKKGSERFAPVIGSTCDFSFFVNSSILQTFVEQLVDSEEGRFTIEYYAYAANGSTINMKWFGYILIDLIEFEDVANAIGYNFDIIAVDGLGWLKNIEYKAPNGPFVGAETLANHIMNCLNKLSFVNSFYSTNIPILSFIGNWHNSFYNYSQNNNVLSRVKINHKAFYWKDTKDNYIYTTCYDVLVAICEAFASRLIFSGTNYWLIQINEYMNPNTMRYFNFFATGIEDPTVFDNRNLAIVNNQTNLAESDLVRIGGGRFGYYAPLREMVVEYKTSARRNLIPGSLFTYNTFNFLNPSQGDSGEILLEELDADNLEARLSFTSNLSLSTSYNLAGFTFQPHIFLFAAIVNQKGFVIPVQEFEDSSGWSLGNGFSVDEKKLKFNVTNTSEAAKSLIAATVGFKYSVKLKINIDQGNMKVYMGGAIYEITESGDYEFDLIAVNTTGFKLQSSTPGSSIGSISNLSMVGPVYWLKRDVTFEGLNTIFSAASWETFPSEFQFTSDVISQDLTFIFNKVVAFDTLPIPGTAQYSFQIILKTIRNAAGTNITNQLLAYNYNFTDNYLEFLPNGNIQNQNDIYEYASDNNVFSSLRARIETKIGDGPVTSSPGAIFVKNNDGNFVLASPIGWTIADIGTGKNISQILVNEVIKGQLKPVRRMINVGFQNKNLNNPWLPHLVIDFTSVIAQDNDNFWVFERGTYECMTDIITGDWFVIKNDE